MLNIKYIYKYSPIFQVTTPNKLHLKIEIELKIEEYNYLCEVFVIIHLF